MAKIPGTIPLNGTIAPSDGDDSYPITFDTYHKGGRHSVADITERNNITTERRNWGMLAVLPDGTKYELINGFVDNNISNNANWRIVDSGSISHGCKTERGVILQSQSSPQTVLAPFVGTIDKIVVLVSSSCGGSAVCEFRKISEGNVISQIDKSDLNLPGHYITDVNNFNNSSDGIEVYFSNMDAGSAFAYIIYYSVD